MRFLDRIFGARTPEPDRAAGSAPRSDDERAVERYRYLLETAPPATIEQVHAEAFAKLTPEQRALVFQQLSATAPAGEAPADDRAPTLAQAATRAELRQPGTMERSFRDDAAGPGRTGPGFGSMLGASLLGTVAGYVVGSALVSAFLPPMDGATDAGASDAGANDSSGGDGGAEADAGAADAGGGSDAGGGFDAGGFGDFGF